MHLFYAPELETNTHVLSEEESRHCIKSLRLAKGDVIYLTDGKGAVHESRIIEARQERCVVEIQSSRYDYGKRNYHLHLAIAPTKNIKRFEWFLEKSTEIGVDEITPLRCFHSERAYLKEERMKKILISAMKQSLKAYLPILNKMISFGDFLDRQKEKSRYVGYYNEGHSPHLKDVYRKGSNVVMAIGPEGDFSEEEIGLALAKGFQTVKMGDSRLRTETAGVIACSSLHLLNEA